MKKIIAVAIALMLMATCMVTVFADETATITVEQVNAAPGETVELDVTFNAVNCATFGLMIEWDEHLTLVDIQDNGATICDGQNPVEPSCGMLGLFGKIGETETIVSGVGFSNKNLNGVVFTLVFTVNEDAAEGSHEVNVLIDNVVKQDLTDVPCTVVKGGVNIAHKHNYTSVVTEPTCTEKGYTTHTCSCGDSYVDTYVDALGHDHSVVVDGTAKAPSCFEDGKEADLKCSRCDDVKTGATLPAAGAHTWGEWVVEIEATCGTNGSKYRECSVCGEKEAREIPATEQHTVADYATVTDATCTAPGTKIGYCSVCNQDVEEVIPALGHDVSTEWSHDNDNHWHACSRCDYVEDHGAHDWAKDPYKTDRIDEGHVMEYRLCTVCGVSDNGIPNTGDNIMIAVFGALAAVAGAAYVTMKRK